MANPSGEPPLPTFVMKATVKGQLYHCAFRSDETCDDGQECDCAALPGVATFESGTLRWTPPVDATAPYSFRIVSDGNVDGDHNGDGHPDSGHSDLCAYFLVYPESDDGGDLTSEICP